MNPGYGMRVSCTACGSALRRVRRLSADGVQRAVRRYACTSDACNWQGLLPRMPARRRAPVARRLRRALRAAAAPLAVVASLSAGLAVAAWHGLPQRPETPTLALGDHHDGAPLPPTHPLLLHVQQTAAVPAADSRTGAGLSSLSSEKGAPSSSPLLTLRRGCVWGKPGRNPYRGTVEQALNMAALPAEVVREIARQVQAGTPVDQLEISTAAIRATASGRQFNPANVAMTYGTTLCLGTRVNFSAGHTEEAALYEAADHAGRVYAVMVPKVCGNVSVLGQLKRKTMTGLSAGADPEDPDLRYMPPMLDGGPQVRTALAERDSQTVPVPGTLVLVLAGLALLWRQQRTR